MSSGSSWIIAGAIISGLAVIFGAFGAHTLETRISADRLDTFETAVKYQMYHGLALLLLASLVDRFESSLVNLVGYGFIIGVLIFSGSLYLLVITDTHWFGAITPIGGVCFVGAWLLLAYLAITEGRG